MAWAIFWMLAARWSTKAVKRPALRRELVHRAITAAGAVLLFWPRFQRLLLAVLWRPSNAVAWSLVAVAIVGFLFTWWARVTLGALWSGNVTRKAEHQVVDRGPYALVRHPIYTGLDLAVLATAALRGTVLACAGAALMIVGFYMKARLEESFLSQELGPEAYQAYARRTPMLIPFT